MTSLPQDFRHALRQLRKSPAFTISAVLMLAIGIGTTIAMFSLVEGVLLRPLPFTEPERLVTLCDVPQGMDIDPTEVGVTGPDIRDYGRELQTFDSLGGYITARFELSGAGDPVQVNASRVTAGVFSTLAVTPLLGRTFTQREEEEKQPFVVLSHRAWQSRFQARPDILGTKILLDRKPYIVIGVMPPSFEFPLIAGRMNQSEFWVPMSFSPEELTGAATATWGYHTVGRLKPGISTKQAEDDAKRVANEISSRYPSFMSSIRISALVLPLQQEAVASARPLLETSFLAVVVVLLIACANLAGLLLVRAIRQRREIAVRLALGARPAVLLRRPLIESFILSLTGGVLGCGLAAGILRWGIELLPSSLPRTNEIYLDWKIAGFAVMLAILTGILSGAAPAFAALRTRLNDTLKEGARGSVGGGHARLRSGLVIAEIAVALVLLTACGLLLRSFDKMRAVALGYQPDHTLVASYSLPQKQYSTQSSINQFNDELLRRIQQLPGVQAAGITSMLPASQRGRLSNFVVQGHAAPTGTAMDMAWNPYVQGDFFHALGIRLRRGRFFTESDKSDSRLVAIVNHKMAELYWPGQDPIGKQIRIGMPETVTPWMTVVGEVDDIKQGRPDEDTRGQIYEPATQESASYGALAQPNQLDASNGIIALRTGADPEQMENALRATVHDIDPQLALTQIQTLEHAVSESEASRRFYTTLISIFATISLALAVLGVYSVVAFSAALRMREMALRVALGSQRAGIRALILASGAKLALVGCAIGFAGAVATSRLLRSFLFGVSPFDPVVMASAGILILLLAVGASLLPAYRASRIDPMKALRYE
jgi:putative ABC transport system permease protein